MFAEEDSLIKKGYRGVLGYQKLFCCEGGDLFDGLSKEDQTDILFIACADSRVLPGYDTSSVTGDLIILHMDDIVPFNNAVADDRIIAAAIDHTLSTSTVTDIVVCGCSNYSSEQPADTSNILNQRKTVQGHIIDQLKRISSCRSVRRELKNEVLALHGWHYEMYTGKAFAFNSGTHSFEEILLT